MFRRLPRQIVFVATLLLFLAPLPLYAAEYHIGSGEPEDEFHFDTLENFRIAQQTGDGPYYYHLFDGDILLLYGDDDSLTAELGLGDGANVTVRSNNLEETRDITILAENRARLFNMNRNSSTGSTLTLQGIGTISGATSDEGEGGAIYGWWHNDIYAQGVTFRNNNSVDSDTGGGVMYLWDTYDVDLMDANFYDNQTGGYGGAIYIFASSTMTGTTTNVTIGATDGNTSTFQGNKHRVGTAEETYNSIDFTGTAGKIANLIIDTQGTGVLDMLDPFRTNAGGNTVNITKIGAGTWKLDGASVVDLTAGTTIEIQEGMLSLYEGASLRVEGANDSFTLANGAYLEINGNNEIGGVRVTFEPDSTLVFNMGYYFENGQRNPDREEDPLLFLDGTTLNVTGTLVSAVFPSDIDRETTEGEYILIQGADELQRGDFYLTVNGRKIASKRFGAYLDDVFQEEQDEKKLVLHIVEELGNTVLLWNNHDENYLWSAGDRNFYDDYALGGENDAFLPNDTVIFGGPGSTDGGTITLLDDAIVSKDNNHSTEERGMRVSGDDNWIFRGGSIGDAYSVLPDPVNETGPDFLAALVFDGSGTLLLENARPNTYHDGTIISGGGTMIVRGAAWLGSTEFVGEETTDYINGDEIKRFVQDSGYGIEFKGEGGHLAFQHGTDTDGIGTLQQRIGVDADSFGTLVIDNGKLVITADSEYQNYVPDKRGGAVNVGEGGKFTIDGQYRFTGNMSEEDGGAIYAGSGTVINISAIEISAIEEEDVSVAEFINNEADGHGGAIAIEGGGAAGERSTLNSTGVLYTSNTAGGSGGALYLLYTNTDISGSTFGGEEEIDEEIVSLGNIAVKEGGAVYYFNVAGSVLEADSTRFQNNQGLSGGAIYVATQTTVNADQSQFIGNATTVDDNGSGGAIALAADESILNANGTAFHNNTADLNGGAISAENNTVINVNAGIELIENTATNGSGGAIYALDNATVNMNDGATISRNTAGGDGGAIYLGDDATLSVDLAKFRNNEAEDGDGGAIRVGDAASIFAWGTEFVENQATGHGGAIAMLGNATEGSLDITKAQFHNNVAGGSGGAVYSEYAKKVNANGAIFTGNKAEINGGAMHLLNADFLDLRNAQLIENTTAGKGGGVYFAITEDIGGEATILLGSDGDLSQFALNRGAEQVSSSIYLDVEESTEINVSIAGSGIVDIDDPFVVDPTGNQVDITISKTDNGTWKLGGTNELGHTAVGTTVDIQEGRFWLNRNAELLLTNNDENDHLIMLSETSLYAAGGNTIETTALEIATKTTMWLDDSLTLNVGSDYTIGSRLSGQGNFTKEDDNVLTFYGETANYGGDVFIVGGTFDLQWDKDVENSAHFKTSGSFNMAPDTTLRVIADASQPAISAKTMDVTRVNLGISGLVLEELGQNIVILSTTDGISGDFSAVGVDSEKGILREVDYLTYKLGFLDNDHKEYGGTIGLRWYSTVPKRRAHGTFTLDGDSSFRLGVTLNDNPGNPKDFDLGWDGKSLTKDGTGTLILATENGYTGTTTIRKGELVLEHALATGVGPEKVTIEKPGTLVLDFDDAYAKSVDGKGNLIKRGTGTVDLTGKNTYSGGTILESGILGISNMSNIGSGTILFTGGILRNNAKINDFNGLLMADSGKDVMLDTPFDLTVTTPITDSGIGNQDGGLIKTGDGILTLTAKNTYGGDTTVRGGTLKLDGSVASDVRVSKGGAIGGDGTINGNLFINNGGAFEWFFGPTQAASPALNVAESVTLLDGAIFRPRTANLALDFDQPIIGWTVMQYGGMLSNPFSEIDNRFSAFFDFVLDYDPVRREIRVSGNLLSSPRTLSDSVTTSLVMANRKANRQAFAQLNREAYHSVHTTRNNNVRGQSTNATTRSAWFTPTVRANRYASTFHVNDPYWFESYGMQTGSTVWSNQATAIGVTMGYERGLLRNHFDRVRSHDYFMGVYHGQVFSDHYEVRSYLGGGFQNYTSSRNDEQHNYVAKYKGGSFEGNIELSRRYVGNSGYFLRPFVGLDFEYAHIETAKENEVGYEFRQYPRSSLTQFFARAGVEVERRGTKIDVHGGATLRGLLIGPVRPRGNVFYPAYPGYPGPGAGSKQVGSRIGSSGVTMNVGFNWYLDKRRSAAFFFDYYADIFFDNDGNGAMHTGNLGVTYRF